MYVHILEYYDDDKEWTPVPYLVWELAAVALMSGNGDHQIVVDEHIDELLRGIECNCVIEHVLLLRIGLKHLVHGSDFHIQSDIAA